MADDHGRKLKRTECGCNSANNYDVNNIKSLPTHVIIQKQVQDVVKSQTELLRHLDDSLNQQQSILEESLIDRDTETGKLLQLKKVLEDKYVSKEDFVDLDSQLKSEQYEHSKTIHKLKEVTDKLEFSLGEIEILTKQLNLEKETFQSSFSSLKNKLVSSNTKCKDLEKKLTETQKKSKKQDDMLVSKDEEIKRLNNLLKDLQTKHKQTVGEIDIEKQQELYIAKMAERKTKKTTKR